MTESITVKTIQAFIYLVKQNFFANHLQSLSELDKNLENLTSEKDFDVANIILDWCEKYPTIKQALRETCQQKILKQDIVTDEEQIPPNINLGNEGQIINNKFLVRKTIETALKQQTKTADSENNE
ncbi:MAG: hypothetical protein WBM32_19175 [Crocosphaera sp.]